MTKVVRETGAIDGGTHFRRYWGEVAISLGGTYDQGEVERICSPHGGWPVNGILRWQGNLEAAAEEAKRLMGLESGCVWYTWPDDPPELVRQLEAAGLQKMDGFRVVNLPTNDEYLASASDARVAIGEDITSGALVQMIAHDIPEFIKDKFKEDSHKFAKRPDAAMFVAQADGEVAAVSRGFIIGKTVGVYGVGVLPEARRKGLGRAVTAAAIQWGRDAGCINAVGATTDMGYALVTSFGAEEDIRIGQYANMPRGPP